MVLNEEAKDQIKETFNDWIAVKAENSSQTKRVSGLIKELADKLGIEKPNLVSAFRLAKMKQDKGQESLDLVSTLSDLI